MATSKRATGPTLEQSLLEMARQAQRTRPIPEARVDQLSGGERNLDVPASRPDADISTTSHSAGPLSRGERRGGADDRK